MLNQNNFIDNLFCFLESFC